MTDAELQLFVATYKSTRKYLQEEDVYLDAGKIKTLLRLLEKYKEQGRRVLVFSQVSLFHIQGCSTLTMIFRSSRKSLTLFNLY
jgi:hypothetical protein